MELCLSEDLGVCSPFYLGCFALHPGIACLGYVHDGIACLASQASDWTGALWDSLSGLWLAVYPSMTMVKLIMIGYCCNCLDGQLNYQASVCWLISIPIYQ